MAGNPEKARQHPRLWKRNRRERPFRCESFAAMWRLHSRDVAGVAKVAGDLPSASVHRLI